MLNGFQKSITFLKKINSNEYQYGVSSVVQKVYPQCILLLGNCRSEQCKRQDLPWLHCSSSLGKANLK